MGGMPIRNRVDSMTSLKAYKGNSYYANASGNLVMEYFGNEQR